MMKISKCETLAEFIQNTDIHTVTMHCIFSPNYLNSIIHKLIIQNKTTFKKVNYFTKNHLKY